MRPAVPVARALALRPRRGHPGARRYTLRDAVQRVLILLCFVPFALPAQTPSANEDFFESRIRPLFARHCTSCHGPEKTPPSAGLRLDRRSGLFRGDGEALVVAGAPERSPLLRAVRFEDPDLQMPPAGKLAAAEIADLEAWIAGGAAWPEEAAPTETGDDDAQVRVIAAAAGHRWFRPLVGVSDPAPAERTPAAGVIDPFLDAALRREGLAPAPDADRRAWLRRATFDLHGLPPTTAELEAFLADERPDAFAITIDRLLASPRYGERQARRWLDVARYADSNGSDENLAMSHAWRYRDWVVRACNEDLPYDRFLTWQLAGDLVEEEPPANEAERRDRIVATGFLTLGPKMLAEQDKVKLRLDVVDEQMDVAGRAFMGLTIGCARCHDHKFDPIGAADYAALAGVFHSTQSLGDLNFVSRWYERELTSPQDAAAREAHRTLLVERERAAKDEEDRARSAALDALLDGFAARLLAADRAEGSTLVLEAEEASRGNLVRDGRTWGRADTVIARTGSGARPQFAEYDVTVAAAASRTLLVDYASAEERPVRIFLNGAEIAADALRTPTGGFFPTHQRTAEAARIALKPGRNVLRLERDGDFPHVDRLLLVDEAATTCDAAERESVIDLAAELAAGAREDDPIWRAWRAAKSDATPNLGELPRPFAEAFAAASRPRDSAAVAAIYSAEARRLAVAWRPASAAAGEDGKFRLEDDASDRLARRLFDGPGPLGPRQGLREGAWPEAARSAVLAARKARDETLATAPPSPDRCVSAADSRPADLPVFVRGDHLRPSERATPRGMPSYFVEACPPPSIAPTESGRLAFARWLTDPRHPLTARVAVNRVWQGLFGRGLVPTASNFGLRGEAPACEEHADLLDGLAREFVASGWSTKALVRTIMLSAAYRRASVGAPEADARDPEARFLARFPRRRLDAESLRDAVLAVSGTLDLTVGGPAFAIKNGDYVTNDQSADAARYDAPRRALYLPVVRNAVYDFFTAFDFGDPSATIEARPTTVVPAQALWLRNSPFVRGEATAFAASVVAESGADPRPFAARAVLRAFGRAATEGELARAEAFISAAKDPERGRADFCRALFCASEFFHVD